jgi:hypothetical protein
MYITKSLRFSPEAFDVSISALVQFVLVPGRHVISLKNCTAAMSEEEQRLATERNYRCFRGR